MADIAFLATIVAFFIMCVGYVGLCGRIVGPDDVAEPAPDDLARTSVDEQAGQAA